MMRRWRVVFTSRMAACLACAPLLLACSTGETQTQEKSSPPPPAAPAEKKEPAAVMTRQPYVIGGKDYYPPVAVAGSDMWLEGGTRYIHIVDTRGVKLLSCNDGRGYINAKDGPLDRPIYIGGAHPTHEGAEPLPPGGADEQELHRMLRDWVDDGERIGGPTFPRELTDNRAENAKKFLGFLEQHIERHKQK